MHVTFRPRNNRGTNGITPIYCRITIKGKRVEFSTNLFAKWDTAKKKAVGKNASMVNEELLRIENELMEIWRDFERSDLAYTSKMILK
jgi:hypothetical protein